MRILFNVTLLLAGVALGLLAAEGILRAGKLSVGAPPVPFDPSKLVYKAPFAPNPLLGWQLKSGEYDLALGGRNKTTHISINKDNSRATRGMGISPPSKAQKVLFIGDSFVFGEGLDDEETLPWRLQMQQPRLEVINHAVGGYGTCHAMLRLGQVKELLSANDIVIYGFSSFHEERNSADPRYDYPIALSSPSHQSGYPRCKVTNKGIESEDSRRWDPIIPLAGRSAISRIVTDAWLTWIARESIAKQRELTHALISELRKISAEQGASFVVLLQDLSPAKADEYRAFLSQSQIEFVDGTEIAARTDLKLPDGHPGPEMTDLWATQLSELLF